MANEMHTGDAVVLQFRKRPEPPKKERRKKTRIARELGIFPLKEDGEGCAFRKTCDRKCMEFSKTEFSEEIKKGLRSEAEDLARWFNIVKHPSRSSYLEKLEYAKHLTWLLDGIVIPGLKGGNAMYSICGTVLHEGGSLRAMQMYSNSQIRQAVEGIEFELDLEKAYVSFPEGPVTGLHQQVSSLLARMANVRLPEDRHHLELLMREGGTTGIRQISWMLGEFTIPHKVRREYLGAMESLVSCASLDSHGSGKNVSMLAFSLSRFSHLEEHVGFVEGLPIFNCGMQKTAPPIQSRPDHANLRGMVSFAIGEFVQALVDMSSRLNSLYLAPKELAMHHRIRMESIFLALKSAVSFLAGKEMPNKKILKEACREKAELLEGIDADPKEQAIARHLIKQAAEQGNAEKESADALLEALNAEGADGEKMLRKLELEK